MVTNDSQYSVDAWLQMTPNMKKEREQNAQAIYKYDTVFLLSIICTEMVYKINENKALSIHYKQNTFNMLIVRRNLNINTTLSKAVLKHNNTKAEIW